jgi:cytochrome c-type biogenesis protein CcmH/NrfG
LTFAIVSSLVICSLVGAAFVSLSFNDVFGGLFDDDTDPSANFENQNSDIISAQETIVAENPDDLEALLLLGNLLGNTDRLAEAIPVYERALQMSPDDVGARVSFARALADGGMQADAELQYEKALEIDPNDQAAHYYLAELYIAASPARTEEALTHYQRAAEIDPGTLIGELSQTQLDTLGPGFAYASPEATPAASPPS